MSYLVLARKYRPASFADIVGQEHVVRTLANAIKLGRVHHAFLFTGARGVGKTTTARVLARALNCEKGPTAEPCGTCPICTEIASGTSPDVLEIDGASNTGVDNVRELRENVRYLPSKGRFKLYIIDEVHMLSQAAFNALLKTLEEPPPHVKFIFATTEPHKIPVTILSRCQRFDFRRVSVQQLGEHLKKVLGKEGVTFSTSALGSIVREAQGSVRDALSLLDQVLSFAGEHPDDAAVSSALGIVERQTIFDLCDAVLARDATRLLQLVAEIDARGHDLADVAGLLVEHWRDLMVAKVAKAPSEELLERSPGELEMLVRQAEKLSRPDLHRFFSLMVGVAEDVSRSQFPRVTFEMGLLRLLEVEPTQSLGDLLTRLDALVAGAAPAGSPTPGAGGGAGGGSAKEPSNVQRSTAAARSESPAARAVEPSSSSSPSPAIASAVSSPSALACAPTVAAVAEQPTPTPVAQPADEATLDSHVEAPVWSSVVERVRKRKPAIASVLEHGKVVRFGREAVEIAYAKGTFYWEASRDPEMHTLLGEALFEQFGCKVALQVSPLEAVSCAFASLAELAAARRRQREREIKDAALAHPAVQGALSILGGEVAKVVPLVRELDESA